MFKVKVLHEPGHKWVEVYRGEDVSLAYNHYEYAAGLQRGVANWIPAFKEPAMVVLLDEGSVLTSIRRKS